MSKFFYLCKISIFLIPLIFIAILKFINAFLSNPEYSLYPFFRIDFTLNKYFLSYIFLILFIFSLLFISKKYNLYKIRFNFFFLVLFAFVIKNILHSNNYDFGYLNLIDYIDKNNSAGSLPPYFLYNKIVYFIINFFNQENIYILFQLNILFGALNAYFIYLISKKLFKNNILSLGVYLIFLLYLPPYSIETLLRIDTLYFLVFTLSIFLTIDLIEEYKLRKSIFLILNFLLLALCREQTIYFLPIYFFFLLINKKYLTTFLILLICLGSTFYVNSFNIDKFNKKLSYKNFHLIVKFIQYGYLTDHHKEKYFNKLNEKEINLVNDINYKYREVIFPTKRIQNPIHEKNQNNQRFSEDFIYLFKPFEQSILELNKTFIPDKYLIHLIEDKKDIVFKIKNFETKYLNKNDIFNILNQHQFYIDKDFFSKSIFKEIENCYISENKYEIKNCLVHEVNRYYNSYILEINDFFYYTKIGMELSYNYLKKNNEFSNHPNIELMDNIILKYPSLYLVQSCLTFFGKTTRMLEYPIGIGSFAKNNNKFIKLFISKVENFFLIIINFFYLFCLLNFFLILFSNLNSVAKNNLYFIVIMPIYYGLFVSFATFAEFSRLMIVVSPLVIINFIIFIILSTRLLKKNNNFQII